MPSRRALPEPGELTCILLIVANVAWFRQVHSACALQLLHQQLVTWQRADGGDATPNKRPGQLLPACRLHNYNLGIHLIEGKAIHRSSEINPQDDHFSFQVLVIALNALSLDWLPIALLQMQMNTPAFNWLHAMVGAAHRQIAPLQSLGQHWTDFFALSFSPLVLQSDNIADVEERLIASCITYKKNMFIEDGFRVTQVSASKTGPRHLACVLMERSVRLRVHSLCVGGQGQRQEHSR